MKNSVTRTFKAISMSYLFFPVIYLLLAAVFFDMSGSHLLSVLLSPFFYILTFWAILTGYGFWEMRRWAWYTFIFTNILITYQCADIVINYSDTHHPAFSFFVSFGLISFITYQISKEIRVPYFLPRIRWWESNSAFQLQLPVLLLLKDGRTVEGTILDFSLKGCFIKTKQSLPYETKVSIGFRIFGQLIRSFGIVVWKTESTVTLPKGIGVKFESMGRRMRKKMRIAERRVQRVLKLYRRDDKINQEAPFQKILETLETSKVELRHLRHIREAK